MLIGWIQNKREKYIGDIRATAILPQLSLHYFVTPPLSSWKRYDPGSSGGSSMQGLLRLGFFFFEPLMGLSLNLDTFFRVRDELPA